MFKIFLLMAISFSVPLMAQDFSMVWSKEVDLYSSEGKIVKRLNYGEIVQVEQFPKDGHRLLITIGGVKYNAEKRHFKSVLDVVTSFKKKILDHEADIKKGQLRISNIESDLTVRQVQALELRRDTALAYMNTTTFVNNNGVPMRTFSNILHEAQYKKLMKNWSKEVDELKAEKGKLQDHESALITEINSLKDKIASFENLGELVKLTEVSNGIVLIVIKDEAQLYFDNKIAKVVAKGTLFTGKPHSKFNGWYEVADQNVVYAISGQAVMKKDDYSKTLQTNMRLAQIQVERINKEVENQQFILKLYQGVARQLESDKFLQGGYGIVKNLVVPIDQDRTFTIKRPNAEEVYVNSVLADKVLKEWQVQSAQLSQESLKNQEKVLALKKQLLDFENSLKLLNR